jgi:hypothetical protein
MKPKNFPARKLKRKMIADGINPESPMAKSMLAQERSIRTKKNRSAVK